MSSVQLVRVSIVFLGFSCAFVPALLPPFGGGTAIGGGQTDLKQRLDRIEKLYDSLKALDETKAKLDPIFDQLKQRRPDLGKELEAVETEQKSLAADKLAATGQGPVYARPKGDVIIPGKYNFLQDGLKQFSSYGAAVDWLKDLGYTPDRSIIQDKDRNNLTGPPPPPDPEKFRERENALAKRAKNAADEKKAYDAMKKAYDENIKAFNDTAAKITADVNRLIDRDQKFLVLRESLKDSMAFRASAAVVDDLEAKGYPLGKPVGDGECVSFLRESYGLPETAKWTKGQKVVEDGELKIKIGANVATFDKDGNYPTEEGKGVKHAGKLLGISKQGEMLLLDQWDGQPLHIRPVRFQGAKTNKRSNDADWYYEIKTK